MSASFTHWQCGRFTLDLSRVQIMGVLNCTPDSFSDGGQFINSETALAHAQYMIEQGVDIIDIGAESTRPGAKEVSAKEEIERLTPVVRALVADGRKPISIDTKKTAVMNAMLDLGVDMINDVNGFEDVGAVEAIAQHPCGICIMHMRGMPENMQDDTNYVDVAGEVADYLQQRAATCEKHGIGANRIMLDPGFGFSKTPEQNMRLIKEIQKIGEKKYPTLIGVSRKSTIGYYLNEAPVDKRLIGSVVLATLGAWQGANVVRVHDVAETKQGLMILEALKKA